MALKSFREDIRRARLDAIKAPKSIPVPQVKVEAKQVQPKPIEEKPVIVTDKKSTPVKKEME